MLSEMDEYRPGTSSLVTMVDRLRGLIAASDLKDLELEHEW